MAFDSFWHVDGVTGESRDAQFAGEMELLSYSFALHQTPSMVAGNSGGRTSGRVKFDDVTVVKTVDSASPALFRICAKGEHVPEVWIKVRRAGGDQHVYKELKFKEVSITSIHQSADGRSEDNLPTETVSFTMGSFEIVYHQQDATGMLAGSAGAGWDIAANVEL